MKNSGMEIISGTSIMLLVVFLAGCTIPHQILPVQMKPTIDTTKISTATSITLDEANWSALSQIPPEIRNDTWRYAEKYSIPFVNWGFDSFNNEVDLFAKDFHNASAIDDLQGKKIGNYSIHIFDETELKTAEPDVRSYFAELSKKPEYQIDNFTLINTNFDLFPGTGRPSVVVYLNITTPENQQILNKYYKGWKVSVAPPRRSNSDPGTILIDEEALNVSHPMNN